MAGRPRLSFAPAPRWVEFPLTEESDKRLAALARSRFVLAPVMGVLTTILMTVAVGYHAVFTLFLGVVVGIGVLLVLPRKGGEKERGAQGKLTLNAAATRKEKGIEGGVRGG